MLASPPLRCTRYAWCVVTGPHTDHFSVAYAVPALGGQRVSVLLAAEGGHSPSVAVEVRFSPTGPLLPVLEVAPVDALLLAEALQQLSADAQAPPDR